MYRNEMLIDRIREIARGQDEVMYNTLIKAADLMENQANEIKALKQICEKQAVVNQQAAQMALELDTAKAELVDERHRFDRLTDFELAEARELTFAKQLLEVAGTELATATQRMIELEQALAQAENELEEAEMCIDGVEDSLNRGTDNDWAREAITNYRKMKEGQ